MQVTTTRRSGGQKPFAWSYSKLKNFETCPKRHFHVDICKQYKEESEALTWGNKVHDMMAEHITKGTPLQDPVHRHWAQEIFMFHGKDVRQHGARVLTEQQLAINDKFQPCEWFGKDAWFRAKVDAAWLLGPVGTANDWKTGRIEEDSPQLALTALTMFMHYPELQIVRSRYIWLKEDGETTLDIRREELGTLWNDLSPRVEALKKAHETNDYPPTPNRVCERWCPVRQCPYHGTRQV